MNAATITKNFINLIYPLHCPICKKSLGAMNKSRLCEYCISKVRRNPRPHCASCGRPMDNSGAFCAECKKTKNNFTRAYSACLYEGALKEAIHLFKYGKKLYLSGILSSFMIDFIKDDPAIIKNIDVVTFVPLNRRSLREREFNQSKLLGAGISKEFYIPISDTMDKAIITKRQNELTRNERLVNLKGAFRLRKGTDVLGLGILLIDDVMTTGATLNECASVLLAGGAREVRCLTLARGA